MPWGITRGPWLLSGKHHVQQGAGHYGIFSGSQFRKHIRPLITDFIHKFA